MTTETPRKEDEVTSFYAGVEQKLLSAPMGFLGAYLLALAGDRNIQENSAIFVFYDCSYLRRLSLPHFHTRVIKVTGTRYCVKKAVSFPDFHVISVEMFV